MKTTKLTATIFLLFPIFFTVCWSQPDNELRSRSILVRSPDTDESCTKNEQSKAVSVGNENVSIQIGDRFQIITHKSGVMNAKVIDKCKPSTYFQEGLFVLRANDYIDWEGDYDALFAIKGDAIQPDQVGSASGIRLNRLFRASVFDALKGRVPPTDTIVVESGTLLSPPNSTRLYLFVSIEHFNIENYRGAGDKAIASKGLLFEIRGSELPLLIAESGLESIFSISDVDNDGIWELLVHSGGWGGGTYELRFFDGSKFTKSKLQLYEWSH